MATADYLISSPLLVEKDERAVPEIGPRGWLGNDPRPSDADDADTRFRP